MSAESRDLESWERDPFTEASPLIDGLRRRCAGCPPVLVLSAAAAGALPPESQAAVDTHVDACPLCLALRSDLEQLEPVVLSGEDADRILGGVVSPGRPARSGRWSWSAWVPASLAGAVLVAMLLFAVTRPGPGPAAVPPVPASTPASAEPVAPPSPPGPALTKPAVKLTMLALTWRSAAGAGFAEDIAPAMTAFREDRFAVAQTLLARLARRYPSSVEIPFYQGVSELYLHRAEAAVGSLRRAERLADDTFLADARWYLGIAMARAGFPAEARSRFEALCAGTNPYKAAACEAAR
jgi:hypothetical protein